MDDTTFLATWDDTDSVGVVNLTKDELKEFATRSGSDKGEYITSMLKTPFSLHTLRSRTRNNNGNGRPCVQIETEV